MSIKGNGQELYIGKQSARIRDWMYNTKNIKYDDLSKIEYSFRTLTEGGYMEFHDSFGHFERFYFPQKSNDAIQRAVDYIAALYPELEIVKHNAEDDPFYSKNIFIALISMFCFWPIGAILLWKTGKRTTKTKIVITISILCIHIGIACMWFWYQKMMMNAAVNDMLNQINNIY